MNSEYTYPGTDVLVNLADIRDPKVLHDFERGRTALRQIELDIIPIKGSFDLEHLKAIHKHLFQDVYPFAGQLRTVNIAKNGFKFCDYQQFDRHADYVFGQLKQDNFLKNLSPDAFAKKAAYYYQEVNFGHYFREGNGRSIRSYFQVLSNFAGHELDWSRVPKNEYMAAVKESDDPKKLDGLVKVFQKIITPVRDREITFTFADVPDKGKTAKQEKAPDEKWIEPKPGTTLKDLLKKTDGLPAMDNPTSIDAKILNSPVSKYQLITKNGNQSLRVQIQGREDIHNIRLEKTPYLTQQLKNNMLDQAAATINQPVIQMDRYMEP
ncbi:Fic family protein [Neobacillus pocheonensis]|uniref:Fic/DOC family protein n=1 Tax=Neobacillus pocheonensis TaxID=363869 RepID=UPI003D2BC108